MKTIREQLDALAATRAVKVARMQEIAGKASEEGRSMDTAEAEEFDTITGEVKTLDADYGRLTALEAINQAMAQPVTGAQKQADASQVRGGGSIQVRSNAPAGTGFTRYVIALARSHGNLVQAAEIAKKWDDSTPEVAQVLRAAVAAGTTTDPEWAAPLVQYQSMASEFVELLRPQTIIGKITGLRTIPFNVKIAGTTQGSSVGWGVEGKAKPVSEMAFGSRTLARFKAAGIVVLTEELVRESSPSAEAVVRADLIGSMAQFLDEQFINPAVAGVPGVAPASITNGAAAIAASGTDLVALHKDTKALVTGFINAKVPLSDGVWVRSPTMAMAVSMMRNALGQVEYPAISMRGGRFMDLPVVVSESVSNYIALIAANEIYLADNGETLIDASREASLEMESAPGVAEAPKLVSLWQQNLVGVRAERFINWARRRDAAVGVITGAAYA